MTSADTAGQTLHAALPLRAQVHISRTRKFDHDAAAAFDRGWTLDQLVQRITSGELGDNPGGTISYRLQECGDITPPPSKPGTVPFCSPECRDDAGWVLDTETGMPVEKCPCRTPQEAKV